MSPFHQQTILLLIILTISGIRGDCRKTFVTYCDNLKDYLNYETDTWRQLIIGNLNYRPTEDWTLFDLYRFVIQDLYELEWLAINNQFHGKLNEEIQISICSKKLRYLQFYKNNFNNFFLYSFNNYCPSLIEVNLVDNNIKQINGKLAFGKIDTMDFSQNNLIEIKEETFQLMGIRQLIIRSNRLSSIEANAFNDSLEILNLDHNEFGYVPDDSLMNLANLKVLTMSHNRISLLPKLDFLKKIEKFDFSYNLISNIRTKFQSLSNLKHIDLSHNLIKRINFVSLIPRNEFPKKISIAFNSLTQFSLTNAEWDFNFTAPVTLILFGNPWICQCLDEMNLFLKDRPFNRTECDLSLFGNGRFPSCVNQRLCVTIGIESDTTSQDSFLKVLDESKKDFTCNVDLDMLYLEREHRAWGYHSFPAVVRRVGNETRPIF